MLVKLFKNHEVSHSFKSDTIHFCATPTEIFKDTKTNQLKLFKNHEVSHSFKYQIK